MIILALIASAIVVLFVFYAEADESSAKVINSGPCGPNATYNLYSSGTLEITGSGEMYQYDATPAPWYEFRDNISKIVISDNITKLGALAFVECKHVTELTMPITLNSVISDRSPAFAGCSCIEKINFTSGNGGYGYNYAANPVSNSWYQNAPWYQSRGTLKEINFADDVKAIGSDAFRELNITSIVLPDSVVHLGNHCFFNCTKLTDLTIPVSLNSYGSDDTYPAFKGCTAIQKITFTNGNGVPFDYTNWWGDYNTELAPWNMYSDVAKTIIIPDNVTSLGKEMFRACNVKELSIPICLSGSTPIHKAFCSEVYTNLEKLIMTKGTGDGYYSVDYSYSAGPWDTAPNLKTVIVEEGVTRIESSTFTRCSMGDLILPNSLTSLKYMAFNQCKIKTLTIPISLNPIAHDKSMFLSDEYAFQKVSGIEKINFIPGSGYGFDYEAYKGDNWYQFTPWYLCRNTLKEITFAEGITHIGSDAFRDLHVTSLTIPNSVESLGCHAFYNMKELFFLTIPITLDSVGSTKYPAFDQDNEIAELRYTAGTNGIGHDYADCVPFWNYSQNKGFTIIFENGIEYIGTNTLSAYKFADANGQLLEPTAVNLSGHTFWGADSEWLYLVDNMSTL